MSRTAFRSVSPTTVSRSVSPTTVSRSVSPTGARRFVSPPSQDGPPVHVRANGAGHGR
ncbi:hypothetical protein ACKI2C_00275 [Streptomyces brasiliscabiei]|uniref:hypothetical protein n=1 Tax=Streptomyces brasiliscabiei TaxID=2736302 RepID=UPI0038F5DE98